MKASDIAAPSATVRTDDTVADALRLMAAAGQPGVIMVDEQDRPVRVIPGTQVLRLAVPDAFLRDPALVRAVDEPHADAFWADEERLRLTDCLGDERATPGTVSGDATLLEVVTVMARGHTPLLAVVDDQRRLIGTVTLAAVLEHLVLPAAG